MPGKRYFNISRTLRWESQRRNFFFKTSVQCHCQTSNGASEDGGSVRHMRTAPILGRNGSDIRPAVAPQTPMIRFCCGGRGATLLLALARPSINRLSERRFVPRSKSKRVKVRRRPPRPPNISLDGHTIIAMQGEIKKERREREIPAARPRFLPLARSFL